MADEVVEAATEVEPDLQETVVPAEAETPEIPSGGSEVPPTPEATPEGHIDWETRIQEWGGEDAVQDALAIYNGLADEEGVAQLFIEAGRSLGLGLREMQALISGEAPPAEEPVEDESLDEVMTRREFLEELDKRVLQPQTQAAERAAAEAHAAHLQSTIASTLDNLQVPDDDDLRTSVLSIANNYLQGDSDEDIAAAIQKGYAAFQSQVRAEAERYVKSKTETRDTSPKPLASGGAGAPGGIPDSPPTFAEHGSDVMEVAIKRARARIAAGNG